LTLTFSRRPLIAGALAVATLMAASPMLAQLTPAQQDWANKQADFLAANLKKPGWKATASGLQYHKVKANPKGAQPAADTPTTFAYEGKTSTGTTFDSSDSFDGKPSEMVKGMTEGLQMMRAGETWDFAFPPELGYGDRTGPGRPAGTALAFHVTMLKVNK
jgi:FKBP-type peptidyl-prolyl cis-trans isomerase FkpA